MLDICRPPLEAHFHAACFAKCHNPIGPRVASWLVVKESGSGIKEQWKRDTCYGILEAVSVSWEDRMREGFYRESKGSLFCYRKKRCFLRRAERRRTRERGIRC